MFGITGSSFLAGGIYALIATASIAAPVIGIVIGGIYALSCLGALGYRLYKGKKKVQEEYIDDNLKKIDA